jgi:hypothetical protein
VSLIVRSMDVEELSEAPDWALCSDDE